MKEGILMKKSESKKGTGSLIRRFLPYYKKYKWVMVLDLFCAALTTVCELILPMIVREITGNEYVIFRKQPHHLAVERAAFFSVRIEA